MPIIPTPDAEIPRSSNVSLPRGLWDQLDKIADHEQGKEDARAQAEGRAPISYARQRIMRHLLEWACSEYWREQGGRPDRPERKKRT
jgi:hypothetical protein